MKNVPIVLPPFNPAIGGDLMSETQQRERILSSAQELFYSYGIRSVTMDDIARHLSISKKTIYLFFEDKDQIVQELSRAENQSNINSMKSIAVQAKDSIDEILQCMDFVADLLSRLNPNVIYDMQKYHPASWTEFRAFREQHMMGMVESNLKKGIRQGLYRPDINFKVLANLRVQEVEMGMNPQVFPPSKFNIQQVQLEMLEHFLYGILTLKGLKVLEHYQLKNKQKKNKAVA